MADTYLGDVRAMSFKVVPRGWAACNGQKLPVGRNQALYQLLGNRYGGDATNFALPSLPGVPAGHGATLAYCICINGSFPTQ